PVDQKFLSVCFSNVTDDATHDAFASHDVSYSWHARRAAWVHAGNRDEINKGIRRRRKACPGLVLSSESLPSFVKTLTIASPTEWPPAETFDKPLPRQLDAAGVKFWRLSLPGS